MSLPTKEEAKKLLEHHVKDSYQRYHALMVATAMEGYAHEFGEDAHLWFLTGYLHDLDYDEYPETHPARSLEWFRKWGYPEEFIHAVEAHAFGHNGFRTSPDSRLAAALIACDEICGIYYAYQKMNPVPFGEMSVKSIKKRLKSKAFAAKIDRETIYMGCEKLGVSIDDHVANLIRFFGDL
ncbi:HD domain-containing protein [Portibacter marinus]|uniref:HD domain-containing protein n=1 Tax=Portibacter marinus TaxID=2898660 RepID=UPI001F242DB6|nr:HD domain-containing protein [Portibacter marinus]